MFNLKMMPVVTDVDSGSFGREAPKGFGWILIFEADDSLYIWETSNAYVRSAIAATEEPAVKRVWVSQLQFNSEVERNKLYDYLATKPGVKVNGNHVKNMPFETLAFWSNENLGIPGVSDFGEVFQNNYVPVLIKTPE